MVVESKAVAWEHNQHVGLVVFEDAPTFLRRLQHTQPRERDDVGAVLQCYTQHLIDHVEGWIRDPPVRLHFVVEFRIPRVHVEVGFARLVDVVRMKREVQPDTGYRIRLEDPISNRPVAYAGIDDCRISRYFKNASECLEVVGRCFVKVQLPPWQINPRLLRVASSWSSRHESHAW